MICVKELADWIITHLTYSNTTEFHSKDSRTSYSKDKGTSYSKDRRTSYFKDRRTSSTWYPSWWTILSSSTTTTWSCWCSVWSMYVLVVCMCCSTNSIVSVILLSLVGKVSVLPYSRLFSRGNFHKLAYSNFLRENFKNHQEQLVINAFSNIFNKHVKGITMFMNGKWYAQFVNVFSLENLAIHSMKSVKVFPILCIVWPFTNRHIAISCTYLYNSEDTATKIICKKHSKHFETWSWTTTINCWSRCSHHWWAVVHVRNDMSLLSAHCNSSLLHR